MFSTRARLRIAAWVRIHWEQQRLLQIRSHFPAAGVQCFRRVLLAVLAVPRDPSCAGCGGGSPEGTDWHSPKRGFESVLSENLFEIDEGTVAMTGLTIVTARSPADLAAPESLAQFTRFSDSVLIPPSGKKDEFWRLVASHLINHPICISRFGVFLLKGQNLGIEGKRFLHVHAADDRNRSQLLHSIPAAVQDQCTRVFYCLDVSGHSHLHPAR